MPAPALLMNPRLRDLLVYKTFADLRAEAAKTYVNYLWWVLEPLLSMLVFYLVFGLLFQRGGGDFVAFLLIGLVAWNWYRQTLSHAGMTIVNNRALMNQVHVPKLLFPLVTLLTDLTKFLVVLAVLLVFLWGSGHGLGWSYLALPVVLMTQLLLIAALALLLAALVPWLPDLRLVVEQLLHLQFFVSGVFFAASDLPEAYRGWFYLNPMGSLLHDYRLILLEGAWPHWGRLAAIAAGSALVLGGAVWLLRRWDRLYPRIVQ